MSKKMTPEIRFKGYTQDWEQRKLETLVSRVKSYSLSRDVETLEHSEYRYVHYGDIHTKLADVIDESSLLPSIKPGNYELLDKYDLILADASEDYQGIATPAVVTISPSYKLVAGLHTIALRPISVDSIYLYYIFNSRNFRKHGYRVGTGMKVFGISVSNVLNFEGRFPSIDEQHRVGKFLKKIDETIALHQDKLNKLKQLKKGYLKVIFPQKREKAPKLRFARFSSDWEQRKLGDMLEERNEQIPENEEYPLMSFVQGVGVTPKGDRYDRSFLVKDNNKKYKKTELRDFIYSSNNLETGSIGFNKIGKAVISPVYSIFFSKNKLESQFIGILSTRKDFINKMVHFRQGVVYGQWRIHEKDFLSIEIVVPLFEEQRKIISFFKQLDEIIALHHDTVEQLKKVKEIYLQKLFI